MVFKNLCVLVLGTKLEGLINSFFFFLIGLSCDKCKAGKYRLNKTLEVYSGCAPCTCNQRTTSEPVPNCSPDTGVCLNCRNGTMGDHCEKCAPNVNGTNCDFCVDEFWGLGKDGCRGRSDLEILYSLFFQKAANLVTNYEVCWFKKKFKVILWLAYWVRCICLAFSGFEYYFF